MREEPRGGVMNWECMLSVQSGEEEQHNGWRGRLGYRIKIALAAPGSSQCRGLVSERAYDFKPREWGRQWCHDQEQGEEVWEKS